MKHILELILNNPLYSGVFFIVMWILVSYILSIFSGWYRLIDKFRAQSKPASKLMYGVQVRWGSFLFSGNIYTLGSTREGMYLGVLFPFRAGHPPLLIPWHEIKAKKIQNYFVPRIQLLFGGGLSRPFEISEKIAKNIKAGSNGQFYY